MFFKKNMLVVLLLLISASKQEQSAMKSNDFIIECTDVTKYEKLFDNNCYLSPEDIYGNLVSLVQFINEADSQLKIDYFLRNVLFKNTTKYFENKYSNDSYYMDALNDLTKRYTLLADKTAVSISNVKMADFFDAFTDSNATDVMNEVIRITEDEYFSDFENNNFTDFFCTTGNGFCDRSKNLFGINKLDEWSNLNLYNALVKLFNQAYDKIFNDAPGSVLQQLVAEKNNFTQFLDELSFKGTNQIPVSELKTFLNKALVKQIVSYYNPNNEQVTDTKKTTTAKKIVNTTRIIKTNTKIAVYDEVLISVPLAIVFLGIIVAVALAFSYGQKKNSNSSVRPNISQEIPMEDIKDEDINKKLHL